MNSGFSVDLDDRWTWLWLFHCSSNNGRFLFVLHDFLDLIFFLHDFFYLFLYFFNWRSRRRGNFLFDLWFLFLSLLNDLVGIIAEIVLKDLFDR